MQASHLLLLVLALTAAAFYLGRARSRALAAPLGGVRHLHSLPVYYAMLVAIWCLVPALAVLGTWLLFDETIIRQLIIAGLPEAERPRGAAELSLTISRIRNLASGALEGGDLVSPAILEAAQRLNDLKALNRRALNVVVVSVAILGAAWGWLRVKPELRARQRVESALRVILLLCACVAIFTTVSARRRMGFAGTRACLEWSQDLHNADLA